jgi:glycine cleavage system aminomethyltransferase T
MALAGYPLVHDFGDAAAEARACRTDCALFDFSFLECARLEGRGARDLIEAITGRSLNNLDKGKIAYAVRDDPTTGTLAADWTVWRTGDFSFEVMSGRREDIIDLLAFSGPQLDVHIADLTSERAVFAVQGPRTLAALRNFGRLEEIEALKYFAFDQMHLAHIPCTIGRLGYTGELGVEIVVTREQARDLWKALSAYIRPAGFVAADALRIEAGFLLFTNEFRVPVSPADVGLERFGRRIASRKPALALVSFRAETNDLSSPWQPAGDLRRPTVPHEISVTSACMSGEAGGVLGLGYVLADTTTETLLRDPAGAFRNIRLMPRPFYDTAKRRPRAPWT